MDETSPFMRTDDGNIVRFAWEPRRNNFASDQEGRPIYDQVMMAYVQSPGSKQSVPAFEVCRKFHDNRERWNEHFRKQFAKQLAQWQSAAPVAGTPLNQLTILDVAMVAMLKELGIHTVEMLADVHDGNLSNLGMGARKWRDAARAYLDQAGGAAAVTKVAAENEALRSELEALKAQVNGDAPRRGRRKVQQEEVYDEAE